MGGMTLRQRHARDRFAEIKDLRQILADSNTPLGERLRYRARLRRLEALRAAACADRRQRAATAKAEDDAAAAVAAETERQAEIDRLDAIQRAERSKRDEHVRRRQVAEDRRRDVERHQRAAEAREQERLDAIAKAESDRLAAAAKIEANKIAERQAWTIPNYDHWVDRRGRDIPDDHHGDYNLVGQTTMYRCLWVINHQGVLG
jgi:hypothetical protein